MNNAEDFKNNVLTDDPPRLIILDLQLADTDGIEQLRLLKSWRFGGTVVLMSGFDSRVLASARVLAQNLGLKVESQLQKPLHLADLERLFEAFRAKDQPLTAERVREAIDNGEMYLEFQPIINRGLNELTKLEALIRWKHPVAGRISPGDFVPLAENDTATIDAMTNWVLATAVKSYRVLREHEVAVPLAVNLSAKNLHDLSLPDRIEEHLRSRSNAGAAFVSGDH